MDAARPRKKIKKKALRFKLKLPSLHSGIAAYLLPSRPRPKRKCVSLSLQSPVRSPSHPPADHLKSQPRQVLFQIKEQSQNKKYQIVPKRKTLNKECLGNVRQKAISRELPLKSITKPDLGRSFNNPLPSRQLLKSVTSLQRHKKDVLASVVQNRNSKERTAGQRSPLRQILRESREHKFRRLEEARSEGWLKGVGLKEESSYQPVEDLSQGNCSSVQLAVDIRSGKKVVLKSYFKYRVLDDKRQAYMKREASLLRKLSHPAIIGLQSSYTTKLGFFLVLQYMPMNLRQLLSGTTLKQDQACLVLRQLLAALNYCHSLQIIHRDLKLENVLVDHQLTVKLADFGYSSYDSDCHSLFVGTMPYIAPELLQRKTYCGKPVDIWALGVLFYYLLNNAFPFKGESPADLLSSIHSEHEAVWRGNRQQPLISRMLALRPEERSSAGQLLKLLC